MTWTKLTSRAGLVKERTRAYRACEYDQNTSTQPRHMYANHVQREYEVPWVIYGRGIARTGWMLERLSNSCSRLTESMLNGACPRRALPPICVQRCCIGSYSHDVAGEKRRNVRATSAFMLYNRSNWPNYKQLAATFTCQHLTRVQNVSPDELAMP